MDSKKVSRNRTPSLIADLVGAARSAEQDDLSGLAKMHSWCEALVRLTGPKAEQPCPDRYTPIASLMQLLEALALGEAEDPGQTLGQVQEIASGLTDFDTPPASEAEPAADAARSADDVARTTSHLGGKYLTFMLDNEEYGLEILKVGEIIGEMEITKVSQTPDFVAGAINRRGKVIPVIELPSKFGLRRTDYNDQTCIIVVDVGMPLGIIVDTVQEAHDMPTENVGPPLGLGAAVDTGFIMGMGKVKDDVEMLLDIDKVLTSEELVQVQ